METLNEALNERDRDRRLEALTKAELIAYAEANGIKIDKNATKAKIINRIKE